ncbi:MAG TPA: hypothetical protein VF221_20020 [Chloroflexota bacterium]
MAARQPTGETATPDRVVEGDLERRLPTLRVATVAIPVDLAVPAILAVLALLVRLSVGPLTIDDAYITFRYARNLALGHGFVYNVGEQVIGTTTPLYTMVLALVYRLGVHDLPSAALTINALADASTTFVLYGIARKLGFSTLWAGMLALLFALCPLSIRYAAGGMESSLFTAAVLGALAADMDDRPALSGWLGGIALLTRPEGILAVVLIILRRFIVSRRIPWRTIMPVVVVVLPWLMYAYAWTGSAISQSVIAKGSAYHPPWYGMLVELVHALCVPGLLLDYTHVSFDGWLFDLQMAVLLLTLIVILHVAVFSGRIRQALARRPDIWATVAFGPILTVLYALSGMRRVEFFPWYLVPLAPCYLLGVVGALRVVATRVTAAPALLGAALFLGWSSYAFNLTSNRHEAVFAPRGLSQETVNGYRTAAAAVGPLIRPGATVAMKEFGTFGYFTNAHVLDVDGLISPTARRFYGVMPYQPIPVGLLRQERPEWLVAYDNFCRQLQTSAWFQAHYRFVMLVPAPFSTWGARGVLVYRRI